MPAGILFFDKVWKRVAFTSTSFPNPKEMRLPRGTSVFLCPKIFSPENARLFFVPPAGVSENDFRQFAFSLRKNAGFFGKRLGVVVLSENALAGRFFLMPGLGPFELENFLENARLVRGPKRGFAFLRPPKEWVLLKVREFLYFQRISVGSRAFSKSVFLGMPLQESFLFYDTLAASVFLETGRVCVSTGALLAEAKRLFAGDDALAGLLERFEGIAFSEKVSGADAESVLDASTRILSGLEGA